MVGHFYSEQCDFHDTNFFKSELCLPGDVEFVNITFHVLSPTKEHKNSPEKI